MRRLLLVVLCLFFAALVRMELIRGQHPLPPAGETGTKGQASTDREVDLSDLYSRHAILLELDTGRTVGEKDSSARVYPASLTKIMTSLLLLEQAQQYSVSVYDSMMRQLQAKGFVYPLGDTGAFALKAAYYDAQRGLNTEGGELYTTSPI